MGERNSRNHYLIFFDEAYERRPFNLDRLAVSIVKGDYEMEKIALPQITRRLLLEMRPAHADPVINQTRLFRIALQNGRVFMYKLHNQMTLLPDG